MRKEELTTIKQEIPIVFAVDDNYAPFLGVTLESILSNASKNYRYSVYVLHAGLSEKNCKILSGFNGENVKVEFVGVEKNLGAVSGKLHLRDYYTQTTYYRFFIPALFPQYDKMLYLDSDIVVLGDISELYTTDIGDNLIGAIPEEVMALVEVFGEYVEKVLDISVEKYFNAGIAIMNLKRFREENIEGKFISLLAKHKYEVTQDQDYLNILCKDKVEYLDLRWNKMPVKNSEFNECAPQIIHYKMNYKPWFYDNIMYGNYFWKYASQTPYYAQLLDIKAASDETKKEKDRLAYLSLVELARSYINNEDTYFSLKERAL